MQRAAAAAAQQLRHQRAQAAAVAGAPGRLALRRGAGAQPAVVHDAAHRAAPAARAPAADALRAERVAWQADNALVSQALWLASSGSWLCAGALTRLHCANAKVL